MPASTSDLAPRPDSPAPGLDPRPVVLITGGAGFVGRALIHELTRPDGPLVLPPREIRVLDLEPLVGAPDGVRHVAGDICHGDELAAACQGADVVFHLAALISWGQVDPARVHEVNVEGTRRVIEASRAAGVRALVFTSSLDAIYSGRPVADADESFPYPARFANAYCSSKAAAEQLVVAADGGAVGGAAVLRTFVLRPCGVWGPHDPYHVGSFLELMRHGPVVRLGRERSPYQFVYVGNLAHALLLAARTLLAGDGAGAGGQIMFVKDFPPRNLFDHLEPIVRAAGGRTLSPSLALPRLPVKALAYLMQFVRRALRWGGTPLLTPFAVDAACNGFTVRSDKAERLLGYRPIYSEAEAYATTIASVVGR